MDFCYSLITVSVAEVLNRIYSNKHKENSQKSYLAIDLIKIQIVGPNKTIYTGIPNLNVAIPLYVSFFPFNLLRMKYLPQFSRFLWVTFSSYLQQFFTSFVSPFHHTFGSSSIPLCHPFIIPLAVLHIYFGSPFHHTFSSSSPS